MDKATFLKKFRSLKKYLTLPLFSSKTLPGILGILLLSFGAVFWYGTLNSADPIHHTLQFHDDLLFRVLLLFLPLAGIMLWLFRKYAFSISPGSLICAAAAVLCTAFPTFTTLAVSLTFLVCSLWLCFDRSCEKFSSQKFFFAVPALLFAFVFASGLEQQISAYDRLILLHSDWGIYFSAYRDLAEHPFASFAQYLSTGNHFNPSANCLMAVLIGFFPQAVTLFAVNSFLIASAVPLLFMLCRTLKLPLSLCALCCTAAAFNPMLSNQHTALTYGYHPIIFLIPAFLLFCIAREKRSLWGMILTGIFICGIKETVFIFAAGAVLLWGLKKKYLYAAATALLLGVCFWIITRYILPQCDGGSNYFQLFQYRSLGDSVGKIILSPLLAPTVFWGKLFRSGNLSFILLLLLPFIPAIWYAPRFILAALPILCGVLIKDCYLDLHNIVQWYGIEVTAWLMAGAAYGTAAAYLKKKITAGFIAALLLGSFTGFFLVGKTPAWGPYSAAPVRNSPHIGILRKEMKKVIPAHASVALSRKWGAQLTESHRKLIFQLDHPDAEYTILDFSDTSADMEQMMKVRDDFIAGGKAAPVRFMNLRSCQVVIFKRGEVLRQLPFILNKSLEQLPRNALDLVLKTPGLRGKALFPGPPQNKLLLFLAAAPDFQKDVSFTIVLRQKQEFRRWSLRWGYGIIPPYMMKKDQCFVIELPFPSHWQKEIGLEINAVTFEKQK